MQKNKRKDYGVFVNRYIYDFAKSKSFIFICGYGIAAFLHWRHFFAATLLVDVTTVFLITFTYIIIFGTSFVFTKIVSSLFSVDQGSSPFYVIWFFIQLALLGFSASYMKYDSRISVYHEVMRVAPEPRGDGASEVVKQCNASMKRKDWERAYRECLAGAAEGNSEAQTNLAYLYFEGLGPLEHESEGGRGRRLWKMIARELQSQVRNELLHETPKISKSDANIQTELLLRKAADKGLVAAQYNLGVFYIGRNSPYPEIGEKDYNQEDANALKYIRLAALQGDAEAIYNLAVMYDEGRGVRRDRKIADRLYKLSATKGFELAKEVTWINAI